MENQYHKIFISKPYQRISNNHNLSKSQQQTEILSIYKKLRLVLRTHKNRTAFYTENTFCKLFYKPNNQVATEEKKTFLKTDCSNSAVL